MRLKWYVKELDRGEWVASFDYENSSGWIRYDFIDIIYPNPFDAYFWLIENVKGKIA